MEYKRENISPSLRYDVFRRDNFTCQYCGRKAPTVELHVDHIIPVAKGGTNDFNNLITACYECNRGKFTKMPSYIRSAQTTKTARINAVITEQAKTALEHLAIIKHRSISDLICTFIEEGLVRNENELEKWAKVEELLNG